MTPRTLPTAPEAELVTLRSILLDPEVLPKITQIVDYSDFHDEQLRAIYRAIVKGHLAGKPVDPVLITQELRESKLFQGDKTIAVVLTEIAQAASTAAHAEHYARIVASVGQRRRAILRTTDALNRLWGDEDASEVLDTLRGDIEGLRKAAKAERATTADLFDRWAQGIIERQPQEIYRFGAFDSDISKFQFGPGEVVMIGAPPAAGKTAFCGQVVFDALRFEGQEHLKLLIANVEMSPAALLTRQLCRACNVSYSYLQFRDFDQSALPRIKTSIAELRELIPRVDFLRSPFTLEHLRQRAGEFEANIVLVDYAQRFTSEGKQTDLRTQTNAVMDCCRLLADEGRAVIVVSALSRQKGAGGSNYDPKSLGLASFRESSELEYGADSAWLLIREPNSEQVELRQVKNRTGRLQTLKLLFDGNRQQFRDDPTATEWKP